MPARSIPNPTFAIERFTLDNGLRVVLAPDRSAPAVAVAVYYDVGFRSEPKGRTGFAHLFEHLMFEGSANLPKLEHARQVQRNGGVFNGSTNTDYTNYFEVMPSSALELALFLEADRMRSPNLNEETLHNQIDVVKEEIRVNVLNRPYGGWQFRLPAVMFKSFNNSHDGYGSFVDLESATVPDLEDFFDRYYAPSNAVLAVAGDLDVTKTAELIHRHFDDIPHRPRPPLSDCAEKLPGGERRETIPDPMAPTPLLAAGYRVPNPITQFEDFVAVTVLCELLLDGEASRLVQRLVKQDQIAIQTAGFVGPFGNPFEARDPVMFQLIAFYPQGGPDPLLTAIDEEVAKVAEGVSDEEVRRVQTAMTSSYMQSIDSLVPRVMGIAVAEEQRGRAELLNEIPAAYQAVTAADVARVAGEWVRPENRAVLDLQPAAAAGGAA